MSGRKNFAIKKILDAHTLNASFTSIPFNIANLDNVGIQIVVTTTANTGIFSIEASNDIADIPTIFDQVTLSPAIPPLADASTHYLADLNQLPFKWVRIKFTAGVGTNGSVDAFITAKEL